MAKVLVVEDDPPTRQMVRFSCEQDGHEVTEAPDAPRALQAVAASRPDLLILDMRMPGGGGEFVLKMLRMGGKEIPFPVLVITGAVEGSADEVRKQLRVTKALKKPFRIPDLQVLVRQLVKPVPKPPPATP